MSVDSESETLPFDSGEAEQSALPAAALLARLGYKHLTRQEALALRGGRTGRVILEDVLRAQIAKINRIRYRGEHPVSPAGVRRALQVLEDVPLAEGTQRAAERVYDLLRLGASVEQTINGVTKSYTVRYIDWEHPKNNVFHCTAEYTVQRAASRSLSRLDLVLFVNGIPFGVIECKAPSVEIGEAVADILKYQSPAQFPDLFKYVQVVLALNRQEARYATSGTPENFWAVWKIIDGQGHLSEDARRCGDSEAEIESVLDAPLDPLDREALLENYRATRRAADLIDGQAGRLVSEQDIALYCLCRPERLLELTREYSLFDGGVKKIARYQQFYAVRAALRRILAAGGDGKHKRGGGVVWHTQGSGKSLTMVMLGSAIALHPDIAAPRIVIVTDRVDLDRQISDTFRRCGIDAHRAATGAELRRLIEQHRAGVVTTVVHKFNAALTAGNFTDESPNIFVLVDEGHRTEYGTLHQQMRRILPNACYIGFTGTPLLRGEKTTVQQFGGIIHSYSMEQAVRDKAVVPLLYERRLVEQEVTERAIDKWFERITQGLSPEQKLDLKRKYSRAEPITKAEQRLKTEAYDIAEHFRANWKTKEGGYKAQVVAPDKKSAVLLRRFLLETGDVAAEVIISPPGEKEGDDDVLRADDKIVEVFWAEMMARYGKPERYEEQIIQDFSGPSGPDILVVVDKLITGFDVPRNTVLYLTRRLASHTLLQAVARVNRLYAGKDFGFIVDYAGVLGELNRALTEYRALAGFEQADVEGYLNSIRAEVDSLPGRHADLLEVFRDVPRGIGDMEACERLLADEERREEFFEALSSYGKTLRVALSTEFFYAEVSSEQIARYKADLKRFLDLRRAIQTRYALTVNLRDYEPQIAKLLDSYLTSDEALLLTPEPVDILNQDSVEEALAGLGTPASKADAIASATQRTVTERLESDPVLYRAFSKMIRDTIDSFREGAISDAEYLRRAVEMRNEVLQHRGASGLPECLEGRDVAQAYFRTIEDKADALQIDAARRDTAAELATRIDDVVARHAGVVDWREKEDITNAMRADIDDIFFDVSEEKKLVLDWRVIEELSGEVLKIAKNRLP